jgi:hypothetical protein
VAAKISSPNRKQRIVFRRFLTILRRNEQGVPGPFGRASFLGALRPLELQVFERDPEKWVPVFRRDRAPAIV